MHAAAHTCFDKHGVAPVLRQGLTWKDGHGQRKAVVKIGGMVVKLQKEVVNMTCHDTNDAAHAHIYKHTHSLTLVHTLLRVDRAGDSGV